MIVRVRESRVRSALLGVVFVVFMSFLAFYNLTGYPEFQALDEGFRLYFVKHAITYGRWAILTQDGFQAYWRDSTGPVVLLPIMAMFALFEPSLALARSIMGFMLVVSVLLVYGSMRYWYGTRVALLASLCFLFFGPSWLNSVTMGRWVYGEVPAFGLFMLGCWQWSRAAAGHDKAIVTACIAFALSVWAKDLFAPIIIVTLAIVWLIHRHEYSLRSLALAPSLICITALVSWSLFQTGMSHLAGVMVTGNHDVWQLLLSRLFVFSPQVIQTNLKFLYDQDLLLVIPVACYTLIANYQQPRPGRELLPVFVIIWLIWYTECSIGWPRYAYPVWAGGGILLAVWLGDLVSWSQQRIADMRCWTQKLLLIALEFSVLVIAIFWPAQNTVRRLFEPEDRSAIIMAAYIDNNVPLAERIVSSQWEVHFYSTRVFVPIPDAYYDQKIAEQAGKTISTPPSTSFADLHAAYLLDGSENRIVEMVPADRLAQDFEPLFQVGPYCLYRLKR